MNTFLKVTTIAATLLTAQLAGANPILFTEDFGTIAHGDRILATNSAFTFIGWNSGASPSLVHSWNPSSQNASLHLVSGSGGNLGAQAAIGVRLSNSYNVVSLSLDINLNRVAAGNALYFGFGTSNDTVGEAFYNKGAQGSTRDNSALFAAQSLAAFRVTGNASNTQNPNGFATFASIRNDGTYQTMPNPALTMGTGEWHNIHLTINGGSESVTLADGTILAGGSMAFYLDQNLITTFAISNNVSADNFRIYAQGHSGNGEIDALIDNVRIWNGAFAPIPEPSTTAMIGAGALLGAMLTKRGRKLRA